MTLTLRHLTESDRAEWDALVACDPASGFGQSWAWADFKELEGHVVERLGVFDDEALAAGALIHRYPTGDGQTLLFVPDGPVIPWDDPGRARSCLRLVVEAAERLGQETRAIALRIEPHLEGARPPGLRGFVRAPLDVYPQSTLLVGISASDEALLGVMRPKGRYNVKLAQRRGVHVTAVEPERGLRRFYALLAASGQRGDFFVEPYGYFIDLVAALAPAGMARLYIATHQGDDLAAALVVHFGGRATYLYGGSSEVRRDLMASYALHWTAMREARARGLATYDLYGYEPYGLVDHPYAGFSRFKRQFGGHAVRYIGAQDLVFYQPLADAVTTGLAALGTPARRREEVRA